MIDIDSRIDSICRSSAGFFIDVDFRDVELSAQQVTRLADGLRGNSFIRSFNIAGANLSCTDVDMLLDIVLKSTSLMVLNLSGNYLGNDSMQRIRRFVVESLLIREIYMSDIDGDVLYNNFDHLLEAVSKNKSLKVLDLSDTMLGLYESTTSLDKLFRYNNTLEVLSLVDLWENWWEVKDKCFFAKFAASLQSNSSIKHLNLKQSYLFDRDADALSKLFLNNNSLKSFNICIDEMSRDSAMQIASSIVSNKSLMELELYMVSDIDEQVKDLFFGILQHNKNLLFLDVGMPNTYYIECELKYKRSYVSSLVDAVREGCVKNLTYRDFLFHKDQMCYMAYKSGLSEGFTDSLEKLATSMLYKLHSIKSSNLAVLPIELLSSIMDLAGVDVYQKMCNAYGIGYLGDM